MEILIKVVQFFMSLSLLVAIHEFGHFIVARMFKIRVEKFYIFFDPWFSLFKWKRGDTEYGLGWLPLGGYVKIAGMIDESMDLEQMQAPVQPWEFRAKPAWQRFCVMVAGAMNATSNVLRPALQIIKMKKGISVVSGAFLMITPTHFGDEGMLLFADCAVTPNPDAKQLAEIAIASAATAKGLAEMMPRVAMLSFSTHGSAKNESADKMIEATRLAREMDPELTIDGELQLDAAIVPKVAAQKAPNSPLRGTANVLVFPNLDAGNIGYKLTQRMSGGVALGPILQGMAAPVNDLSRGCTVDDIVKMVVITSDQARH